MPITIREIELFCSLLFFSPTSLQRAKNACFSLIFPEKSAFRNGFELRRSDVKKDFFFNIFRRRSVESSSDNFRFFPTNTVSCDIYQKTRNRLTGDEPVRGFESHALRQRSYQLRLVASFLHPKMEIAFHRTCRCELRRIIEMRVDISCCREVTVSEPFLNILHRNATGQ